MSEAMRCSAARVDAVSVSCGGGAGRIATTLLAAERAGVSCELLVRRGREGHGRHPRRAERLLMTAEVELPHGSWSFNVELKHCSCCYSTAQQRRGADETVFLLQTPHTCVPCHMRPPAAGSAGGAAAQRRPPRSQGSQRRGGCGLFAPCGGILIWSLLPCGRRDTALGISFVGRVVSSIEPVQRILGTVPCQGEMNPGS